MVVSTLGPEQTLCGRVSASFYGPLSARGGWPPMKPLLHLATSEERLVRLVTKGAKVYNNKKKLLARSTVYLILYNNKKYI